MIGKRSELQQFEKLNQKLTLPEKEASALSEITNKRSQWPWEANVLSQTENLQEFLQHSLQTKTFDPSKDAVSLGKEGELKKSDKERVLQQARNLIPWKKGPFSLFGTEIDAEWRSEMKWNRLSHAIQNLEGKNVLDIGCNNGYFMFRLLEKNPDLVLGIDPVIRNWAQFHFLHSFIDDSRLFFQLWGVEHVKHMPQTFDLILSLGIIYHHRNPMQQLLEMKRALRPGGEIILETIGIPGKESLALFPEERYAKMKNVWFVPTANCFLNWIKRAKFKDVELLNVSELTTKEQRLTEWCPPPQESLEHFLNSKDSSQTIEGYPAPMRIAVKARRHPDDKQEQ